MANQNIKIINTKLPGFILLHSLTEIGAEHIYGNCRLSDARPYTGIECLAQLGAMHVRFLTDFSKHAFLAKINHCHLPKRPNLNGTYQLAGRMVSRSSAAFSYELTAMQASKLEITANFLYAVIDYDGNFKRENLQDRYHRIFSCLKNVTGQNSRREENKGWKGHLP